MEKAQKKFQQKQQQNTQRYQKQQCPQTIEELQQSIADVALLDDYEICQVLNKTLLPGTQVEYPINNCEAWISPDKTFFGIVAKHKFSDGFDKLSDYSFISHFFSYKGFQGSFVPKGNPAGLKSIQGEDAKKVLKFVLSKI